MKRVVPVIYVFSWLIAAHSFAGSATWKLDPVDGVWENPANWEGDTFPDGPDDIATFGVSNQTAIDVTIYATEVGELTFNPGASAYSISHDKTWYISGIGITNNSGITQNFLVTSVAFVLRNSARAGDMTSFAVRRYSEMEFQDTASADHGTFVVDGGTIGFSSYSTAMNASFTVNAGNISFLDYSTAADGVFVLNGGAQAFAHGGEIIFGLGVIAYQGTAGNATFIANSGTNGGDGGRIRYYAADQSTARMELFGNGNIDISYGFYERSVGSIEGDGSAMLGGASLNTGANNLSTTFAGTIQDGGLFGGTGGSLIKSGSATLTLTNANTYTGGTTINSGVLLVKNTSGSGTGHGPVTVAGGMLGGRGIINANVAVGTGSGAGAVLAPSQGASNPTTITLQKLLTFKADGSYLYRLNTNKATADEIIAQGVKVDSSAQFNFMVVGNKKLTAGTVFTAISNTAPTSIKGTFANLADGSIVMVGVNRLQVSYSGGDGNDLTLTVVP